MQQIPKGLSEESSSKPEVPDEPKGKSTGSSEGESDIVDDETSNEEEMHTDEEEHADDETADDEEEVHEDEEMHDADEVHADDEETEEEIADAEKVDTKKTEEEKVDNEQAGADQAAKDDQAGALISVTHKEKPEFPPSSSSLSMSSDYVIPEQTIPTPILTPLATPLTTIEAQATVISVPDPSPTVLERLSKLEKKVEALSKVDHSEAIKESVIESIVREVLQKTPAFLAQSSSTPGQSSSRAAESLSEYELKKILFDKMDRSRSYMTHDKHQELYDDLLNSMCLDDAITNPSTGLDKEKKRSRKGKDSKPPNKSSKSKESSKDDVVNDADQPQDDVDPRKDNPTWFKQPTRPETPDPKWNKDRPGDDGPEQTWSTDLVNVKKGPLTFYELMATPIEFFKFAMNRLKLDKITKS
ncbi:hypothetical protein Tco_1498622, partial [Tanacetum coccineum]